MPTQTFFRLPEEKRKKLLNAARAEFCRVPFAEASINQIIRAAGIPRGSFYMYFEDKADLFRYLMGEYQNRFVARMADQLRAMDGDLFSAFLALFDLVHAQMQTQKQDTPAYQYMELVRRNADIQSSMICPADITQTLRPMIMEVNDDLLDLQTPEDLNDLFFLLIHTAIPSLVALLNGGDPDQLRQQYQNRLAILRRGAARKQR